MQVDILSSVSRPMAEVWCSQTKIDKLDEVVDIVKMKSIGTIRETCRMVDDITCFFAES